MTRLAEETIISDDNMDESAAEFDIIGQDPDIQAGMEANASEGVRETIFANLNIPTDFRTPQ